MTLTFSQTVAASPTAVFYAMTNAAALREWLCDHSQTDVRENGRFYLHWNQGYHASGEFQNLVPNQSFALRWQGREEPHASNVRVELTPVDHGTEVVLTHDGLGSDDAWTQTISELKDGWESGLANLKSVLETGLDKRFYDRPFLGILINNVVSPAEIAQLGLPVEGGVRISGTAPNTGAANIDLQPDDIVTNLAGINLTTFSAIGEALRPYRAGEKVKVIYYRGDEQLTDLLKLSRRPVPSVPETAVSLSQAVRAVYDALDAELDELLAGVTDAEASFSRHDAEWNVKEYLAHLIGIERETQIAFVLQMSDESIGGFPNNPPAWVKSITAVYPTLSALVTLWKQTESETVALIANLPDSLVARKATYMNIGNTLLVGLPNHTRGHFDDMRQLIAAARDQS
ncbi:MAG: SRPBCC domain-containing protein [Chloroflexota bacterium]